MSWKFDGSFFYFLPPQPKKPLTNPVRPAPVAFLLSIFSANEGKLMWLRAKSKNNGLHGTGVMLGGSLIIFGAPEVKVGSSTNSSRREDKLCSKKKQQGNETKLRMNRQKINRLDVPYWI